VRAHLRSSRYERERNERFEQLNVLHTVSSVLASSLEPEVLLHGTLAATMKYVRAASGVVFLREADERPMTVTAAEALTLTDSANGSLLELYSRIVPLMNGKPLVLEPLPESVRRVLVDDVFADVNGIACTQLVSKGKVLGAVCLFSRVGAPLIKHKTELLSTICNQLTVALENARFYVETKKSAAQLSFVYNLGHNLMTSLEMDELLSYAGLYCGEKPRM
jgi:GAF domain-containing protein